MKEDNGFKYSKTLDRRCKFKYSIFFFVKLKSSPVRKRKGKKRLKINTVLSKKNNGKLIILTNFINELTRKNCVLLWKFPPTHNHIFFFLEIPINNFILCKIVWVFKFHKNSHIVKEEIIVDQFKNITYMLFSAFQNTPILGLWEALAWTVKKFQEIESCWKIILWTF